MAKGRTKAGARAERPAASRQTRKGSVKTAAGQATSFFSMDLWREAGWLVTAGLATFLFLILFSYHPADPGISQLTDTPVETIHNYGGRTGAWLASFLLYLIGAWAFLLPILLAVMAWFSFRALQKGDEVEQLTRRAVGLIVMIVSGSALASLYVDPEHFIVPLPHSGGGILGYYLGYALADSIDLLAATLVLIVLFAFSLSLLMGRFWLALFEKTGALVWRGGERVVHGVRRLDPASLLKKGHQSWARLQQAWQQRRRKKGGQTEQSKTVSPSSVAHGGKQPAGSAAGREEAGKAHETSRSVAEGDLLIPAHASQKQGAATSADTPDSLDGATLQNDMAGRTDPLLAEEKPVVPVGRREQAEEEPSLFEPPVSVANGGSASPDMEPSDDLIPVSPRADASQTEKTSASSSAGENDGEVEGAADDWQLPSPMLLNPAQPHAQQYSEETLRNMGELLEKSLRSYGIKATVEAIQPGPVITRFEIMPAPGVKVSQITNLAKDLARSLSVPSVRVVEIIPGKSTVGIEIPNLRREIITLREIIQSEAFQQSESLLSLALGKNIAGEPVVVDLARMPHMLVAGTTGSGKSVGINTMLLSLLFKASPDEVRMILVDPKQLELSVYADIPHLLAPVVTDMNEAEKALNWCVSEMERRYRLMSQLGVRNIQGFNEKVQQAIDRGEPIPDPLYAPPAEYGMEMAEPVPTLEPLPYIVVMIDEFADMIMVVGKKVEMLIARLAQKARAAGIHLILATQRPTVNVVTGLIKSNIPGRIAFKVSSKMDSRTILDQPGAEQLLGKGDMLLLDPSASTVERVHGALVEDEEVHRVAEAVRVQRRPQYIDIFEKETSATLGSNGSGRVDAEQDPMYDAAVQLVLESRKASASYLQRQLGVGFNRASRMIEAMEAAGIVSPLDDKNKRTVLVPARGEG